jgi:hypothetical protein
MELVDISATVKTVQVLSRSRPPVVPRDGPEILKLKSWNVDKNYRDRLLFSFIPLDIPLQSDLCPRVLWKLA